MQVFKKTPRFKTLRTSALLSSIRISTRKNVQASSETNCTFNAQPTNPPRDDFIQVKGAFRIKESIELNRKRIGSSLQPRIEFLY